MSLKEKYPNLTGEESVPQIVREALSTVGIVNDAKVTNCVVELFEALRARENDKVAPPAPPENPPAPPTEEAEQETKETA